MRSERGYAGYRLMVVMALVALAVWLVPTVFLRGAERTGVDPTGPIGVQPSAPAPIAGATAPVAGVTGGGGGTTGPITAANDLAAQATLNDAIRVAQVYYAEHGSFDGFGPDVARTYDPNVEFTAGGPGLSLVSLRGLSPTTVVLVMLVDGGGHLCAAANGDVITLGRADALTPLQCQGGWE